MPMSQKVQSRNPAAASWTDLGTDMFSPFVDTRPIETPGQPQVLEYRACYLVSDQPTLEWSSVLVVTVSPS
ncbi:hypothetical protein [Phragmitibacter flavus]|nr:hypothetical protein [Phragmitibacter flavus]